MFNKIKKIKLIVHLVNNFITLFSSFIGILIFTNYYTIEQFGQFSLSQTIFLVLYSLSFSNYYFYLNKKLVEDKKNKFNYLFDSFIITFCFSCLIYSLLIFTLPLLIENKEILNLTKILCLALILHPMTVVYHSLFVEKKHTTILVYATLHIVLSIPLKLFVAHYGYSMKIYAYTYILDVILSIFILNFLFFFKSRYEKIKLSFSRIFQNLKVISLFPIIGFFSVINLRIDLIMVSHILGDFHTSLYSISSRIVLILVSVYFIILNYVYPIFLEDLRNGQINKFNNFFNGLVSLILSSVVMLVIFMFFFGDYILILFGENYLVSKKLLILLTCLIFFICFSQLWISKEHALSNSKKILSFYFLTILINISLNYYLIALYETYGAALSSIISYILSFAIINLKDQSKFYQMFLSFFSRQLFNNIKLTIKKLL